MPLAVEYSFNNGTGSRPAPLPAGYAGGMTARRLAPDERREAILAVARELFGRRPYPSVSVAELAAAAGVSAPLVVFYFGSKRALYLEVLSAAVTSIAEGLAAVPGPPSLERLDASVRFYAGYARTHRAGFLSYLRGGSDTALPEATALVETLRAELTERIALDVSTSSPPADRAAAVALRIAVRGHLSWVDAAVSHWLTLPDDEHALIGPDTLARLAVGAFTGALQRIPPTD